MSSLLGDGDALVERYRSASESYTAEEVGAYYLEMRLGNGTSLLVPLMKPIGEDYALGCVVETADTYTGLSFRPCLPAKFASWASYWAFSQGGRYLPKLKPADLKGDHFAAWQTENTPFFVLGEDGKGYLRGNGEEDRILPVLYTREEDGTVVLWYENEAGETVLRHVYRPQNFGFVYDAEASFGYGVYQFSDGTAFYYNG